MKTTLQLNRRTDENLDILLDEIQLAMVWSRPSILLAILHSKTDQEHFMTALERKLHGFSVDVAQIMPNESDANILPGIKGRSNTEGSVFFLHGLGNQIKVYQGLNLHREILVEKKLKVIFWLTFEELTLLSKHAPDLWAFRHRVIELGSRRGPAGSLLPSGALLWHLPDRIPRIDDIREKIISHQKLLQTILPKGETLINHALIASDLAYYYWSIGNCAEATGLLQHELKYIPNSNLYELHSLLLNAQAINCYDQAKYKDALQWIEKALKANPGNSLLWANHGIICRAAGKSRRSPSSIKKAIALNPSAPAGWGVSGYVSMSMGKFAMALKAFEQAQALHPGDVYFYPAIAFCHHRMGSMSDFRKFMKLIAHASTDNEYMAICKDGLLEGKSSALERLSRWIKEEKIARAFIWRDPHLQFIFGKTTLQALQ